MGEPQATADGALPEGDVAFLFTDIERSTRLLQRLGVAYAAVLEDQRGILRQATRQAGGAEVDATGDGFFAAFPRAESAVEAAIAATRSVASHPWPQGGALRIRVGVHAGAAMLVDGGYVGLDVHRVARICSAGHGGQILVSQAARSRLGESTAYTFKDLGQHQLKDIPQPEQLYQVVAAGLSQDFPPLSTAELRSHNLPSELTQFVGRREQVERIRQILSEARLVTLLGPGGIGKTRIALRMAADSLSEFADGVYYVRLASVREPQYVPPAIGAVLGVSELEGQPMLEALQADLGPKSTLLVLDNFEQVTPAAGVVSALLSSAPGLKALVTSRTPLQLRGEQLFRVPPLQVPEADAPLDLERLERVEAIELFVRLAHAADADFALTEANAPDVMQIVRRLDGLPLAIELAAAKVRMFPAGDLRRRLEQSFEILSAGPRDLPARHRALRDTVAWSYELLEPGDQAVLRALSVCVGGLSLAAAEALAPDETEAVERSILTLVDASLLQRKTVLGELRFSMMEAIGEFALSELIAAGEAEQVQARQAAYLVRLAESAEPQLTRLQNTGVIDQLTLELDNFRSVLRHRLEAEDVEPGLRLATALWRFWHSIGQLHEGREWLERYLSLPGWSPTQRAKALVSLAGLAYWQADYAEALQRYSQALEIFRQLDAEYDVADTQLSMSTTHIWSGEIEVGERLADQVIESFRQLGAQDKVGMALMAKGFARWKSGDLESARPLWQSSLEIALQVGDQVEAATKRLAISAIAFQQGDAAVALQGTVQALDELHRLKNVTHMIMALDWVAAIAVHAKVEGSLRLAGAAEKLRAELGGGMKPEASGLEGARAVAARSLKGEQIDRLYAEGRQMGLDQAIQFAHALAAEARAGG